VLTSTFIPYTLPIKLQTKKVGKNILKLALIPGIRLTEESRILTGKIQGM
jgi:hypothetical protein